VRNIITSRLRSQEIPEIPVTSYVLRHAARLADSPALIDGVSGRALNYGELNDSIRRIAGGLMARGFGRGDVLAILAPNCPEYPVVLHGALLTGGTVTTINPLYTAREIAHQMKDAGARFLFTVATTLAAVATVQEDVDIESVFVLGDVGEFAATPLSALYGEPLSDKELPVIAPRGDIAVLPYSSGTTGLPKGVMLTHYNMVANLVQLDQLDVREGQCMVAVLPMFHIYGMQPLMNCILANGGTIITMPRFELRVYLELHQRYRVTRAYVVPPIVLALARDPCVDDYDLSALEFVFSAAAPLGTDLEAELAARLDCAVVQGYGLTETGPVTHLPLPGEPLPAGSIGVPLCNTECRMVDVENGDDLGPGESGELWVRSPSVMHGYLNAPEATAATITEDGWLRTGDIGLFDEAGYFYIVDRLKELIKYKGFQVAPAELEGVLLTHPAVADAAVVPMADEEAGELPMGFVVMKPGKDSVTPQSLMAFVADQVANFKRIRRLEIIDAIPKSSSGKILRHVLRDRNNHRHQPATGENHETR
jgi:acyl-CoA synthetase (AMP-forming)/AMP-acid ligase II